MQINEPPGLGWYIRPPNELLEDAKLNLDSFKTELSTTKKKEPVEDLRVEFGRIKEKIAPEVRDYPEVKMSVNVLEGAIREIEVQKNVFWENYAGALKLIGNPDWSPNTINNHLNLAKNNARTEQEEKNYKELEEKCRERQKEIDEPYDEKIREFWKQLEVSQSDPDQYSAQALDRLTNLNKDFKALQPSTGISPDARSRGDFFEKTLEKEINMRGMMLELFSSVPDWAAYQSVLRRLASLFHDRTVGVDAAKILMEMDDVRTVAVSLQDFATSYAKSIGNPRTLYQESASLTKNYDVIFTRFSRTLNNFLPSHDIFVTLSQISPYTPGAFISVRPHLENMTKCKLYPCIEGSTNRWYYLTEQPPNPTTQSTSDGSYYYATTFSGDEIQPCDMDLNQLRRAIKPNRTPHAFATETQESIDNIKDNAETVVYDIMRSLSREDSKPDIDPIIQCIVMEALIKDMSKIDPFFAENFKELLEIVDKNGIGQSTSWIDVESADTFRKKAQIAVEEFIPKIEPAITKTGQDRVDFMTKAAKFHPRFEWVGVLIKTGGTWDCVMKPDFTNNESGDLYILSRSNQTVEPVKIGQFSSGKIELHDTKLSLQCAPVFLVQQ